VNALAINLPSELDAEDAQDAAVAVRSPASARIAGCTPWT